MWVCVCVEYKGQQRPETLFPLELESRAVVSYLTWVLGIEPRPLRAVCAVTAEPPLSFSQSFLIPADSLLPTAS